ncbi:MAG: hypothetical protein IPL55_12905 [Saprospiraceae bacterium]|jgi:hypothetical protein|nr:hypothetical protein [Saprospiraceae bacterium]
MKNNKPTYFDERYIFEPFEKVGVKFPINTNDDFEYEIKINKEGKKDFIIKFTVGENGYQGTQFLNTFFNNVNNDDVIEMVLNDCRNVGELFMCFKVLNAVESI